MKSAYCDQQFLDALYVLVKGDMNCVRTEAGALESVLGLSGNQQGHGCPETPSPLLGVLQVILCET